VNPDGSRKIDSSPEYCLAACEKSLKRLGVETIDLYYCHRVDKKTPIEMTVEAMTQLKKLVCLFLLSLSPSLLYGC
jgi:aryl-alcohol dehydrogenase-like predicted oxidoreductase